MNRPRFWQCAAALVLLIPALTGCGLLHGTPSQPKPQVRSLRLDTNAPSTILEMSILQAQVMRAADVYASTVAQAADDFSAKVGTPEARLLALKWKVGQATAAYVDATGPNPALNVLDLLVLVTLSRMVVEDYDLKVFGDAALPLLETHRRLESNAWSLAGGVLKPAQQQELRDLIDEWRRKNPDQRYIGAVRFKEFVQALGRMPRQGATTPTSIFSLLFLDPLAGLDPTAAAIEETRLLGERAMYYTQRMPFLLSWQTELLAYQLATQPESRQILSDAEKLAASADAYAKVADQLPQLINDQRQAAIQQLLDGLGVEEKKARDLLAETRQTLEAASNMAVSVNTATKSLDEFVRYVSPTNTSPTTVSTNGRPFDVLDYGKAAGQIGDTVKELDALLSTVNQSTPQLARLSQQTTEDANRLMVRAFWLGLALILVLLVGSVLAGLSYRALAKNLNRDGRKPSESSQ